MGGLLEKPVKDKECENGQREDGSWRYGISAMQGWRPEMEDAHFALPDFDVDRKIGLFGVFDGHGGSTVSATVAKHLPEMIKNLDAYKKKQYSDALYKAFLDMDKFLDSKKGRLEIMSLSQLEGIFEQEEEDADKDQKMSQPAGPDHMGCTSVVALVKGGPKPEVWVANAGDSRCVLVRGASAFALSHDHKPTLKEERKRILEAGGFVEDERVDGDLSLSRAHGDFFYKQNKKVGPTKQKISCEPDIKHTELKSSDSHLLLGCDGIFEKVSNQKLVDFMLRTLKYQIRGNKNQKPNLSSICSSFLDHNLAKNPQNGLGCDNMSLMMIELGRSPLVDVHKDSKNDNTPKKGQEKRKRSSADKRSPAAEEIASMRSEELEFDKELRKNSKTSKKTEAEAPRAEVAKGREDAKVSKVEEEAPGWRKEAAQNAANAVDEAKIEELAQKYAAEAANAEEVTETAEEDAEEAAQQSQADAPYSDFWFNFLNRRMETKKHPDKTKLVLKTTRRTNKMDRTKRRNEQRRAKEVMASQYGPDHLVAFSSQSTFTGQLSNWLIPALPLARTGTGPGLLIFSCLLLALVFFKKLCHLQKVASMRQQQPVMHTYDFL